MIKLEIKQYTTLIIGLIVGVLLIAGVVAPVIANVSSDNGGGGETVTYRNDSGTSDNYYITLDENSSYTVEVGDVNPEYNWPDLNVTDLNTGTVHYLSETSSAIYGSNLDDISVVGRGGAYLFIYGEQSGTSVTVSGTSVTFQGEETAVMQDALLLSYDESGSYVLSYTDEWYNMPYLNEDSIVYMYVGTYDEPYGTHDIVIKGSSKANTVVIDDVESDSAEFIMEDNRLVGVTVILNDQPTDIRFDEQYDYMGNLEIFAPVEVTIGSGSGSSGLSPTLSTLLSVIPLVLTVGLVIGAIGFLRMKN